MEERWILRIRSTTKEQGRLTGAFLTVSPATTPHIRTGSIRLSGFETSNLLALFAMQSTFDLRDLSSSPGARQLCLDEWRDAPGELAK